MIKNYTITVNGTAYDVTVEEGGSGSVPVQSAPKAMPKASAPAAPVVSGEEGSIKVKSSVPGKVFKVEASVGQTVKTGQKVMVLEAMKMEIDVVAPQDGTIKSINASVGDAVESGDVLATMD